MLFRSSRVRAQTFTTLHSFTATSGSGYPTNNDGARPYGGVILSDNTLYGTGYEGGSSGYGTLFKVNTDGTGFTNLHTFAGYPSDGANPYAGLILSGHTLYGTARNGGTSGSGTVFAVNTDGTGFTTLYRFTATVVDPSSGYPTNSDGAHPQAGLILTNNTLYGTAERGGSSGNGTVFSLSLPLPQLTIIRSGLNVILTWPTNAAGYTLQSAPIIAGTFTNISGTNPYTNAITSTPQFFRLSH